MTQGDMTIDNDTRPSVRADITANLQALASTSKGTATPGTPYAGQQWIDDNTPSSTTWTWNLWTGSANIKIGEFNTTTNLYTPFVGAASILASPAFTGTPTAPTASGGTNTTQIATTAFVTAAVAPKAPIASPTFTGTPAVPTASPGTNTTQAASTAFVTAAVALAGATRGTPLTLNPYATSASGSGAHGLPATPNDAIVYLECLSAEAGYSAGDRIIDGGSGVLAYQGATITFSHDATNTYYVTNTVDLPDIVVRSGGFARQSITPSKWKVVIVPMLWS